MSAPGFFAARTYGAAGDGLADDTAALNAALQAANAYTASTGGTAVVALEPGARYLLRSVSATTYFVPRGVVMMGMRGVTLEGQGATLLARRDACPLSLDACEACEARNLRLSYRCLSGQNANFMQARVLAVAGVAGGYNANVSLQLDAANGLSTPTDVFTGFNDHLNAWMGDAAQALTQGGSGQVWWRPAVQPGTGDTAVPPNSVAARPVLMRQTDAAANVWEVQLAASAAVPCVGQLRPGHRLSWWGQGNTYPALSTQFCGNVALSGLRVEGGSQVLAEYNLGRVQYRDLRIAPATPGGLGGVNGMVNRSNRGGVDTLGSLVRHANDDSSGFINSPVYFWRTAGGVAGNTLQYNNYTGIRCTVTHPGTFAQLFRPGDAFAFADTKFQGYLGRANLAACVVDAQANVFLRFEDLSFLTPALTDTPMNSGNVLANVLAFSLALDNPGSLVRDCTLHGGMNHLSWNQSGTGLTWERNLFRSAGAQGLAANAGLNNAGMGVCGLAARNNTFDFRGSTAGSAVDLSTPADHPALAAGTGASTISFTGNAVLAANVVYSGAVTLAAARVTCDSNVLAVGRACGPPLRVTASGGGGGGSSVADNLVVADSCVAAQDDALFPSSDAWPAAAPGALLASAGAPVSGTVAAYTSLAAAEQRPALVVQT